MKPFNWHEPRNHSLTSLIKLWCILLLLLIGFPLAGTLAAGHNLSDYLVFPPLPRKALVAGFSWGLFIAYIIIDLGMITAVGLMLAKSRRRIQPQKGKPSCPLPRWGWWGLIILGAGWILAWNRFSWFAPLQPHTFCLPWIGYIILANAWCEKRSGTSLLTRHPARFALLFPTSAMFWWFFEYLNRFVQNWYYVGADDFGPLTYTVFASLAFATVLPAVLSTYALLLTFPVLGTGLTQQVRVRMKHPRSVALGVLLVAGAGLFVLGIWPNLSFGLVWVAPLLIILAVQTLTGGKTILAPLRFGDWRPVITAAIASLICGFFWEMWNIGSLARWAYAIPYVDRFRVFAMPILGYGGYLPFGLECLAVGQLVLGNPAILEPSPHCRKR